MLKLKAKINCFRFDNYKILFQRKIAKQFDFKLDFKKKEAGITLFIKCSNTATAPTWHENKRNDATASANTHLCNLDCLFEIRTFF